MGSSLINYIPPPPSLPPPPNTGVNPQQPIQNQGGSYGGMARVANQRLQANQAMYQQQQFQPFQQQSLTYLNNEAPNPFFGKYFN